MPGILGVARPLPPPPDRPDSAVPKASETLSIAFVIPSVVDLRKREKVFKRDSTSIQVI